MIVDNIKERIEDALVVYFRVDQSAEHLKHSLKQIFLRLQKASEPEKEFSLMARYCFDNFSEMIVPLLATPVQKKFVAEAFAAYQDGEL